MGSMHRVFVVVMFDFRFQFYAARVYARGSRNRFKTGFSSIRVEIFVVVVGLR